MNNSKIMCNGVIPCLPSGLAKSNNIMSMFVLFSWLFGYFESLGFLKMVGQTLHQSIQTGFLVNFLKVQHRRPSHYQEKSIRWSMFICSTSAFRKAMVKIATNTWLCPLSSFNFTSLALYFWLYIAPLLTRHHISLLSPLQSSSRRVLKRQNFRIERTLQGICSILDTFIFNAFQVEFLLISFMIRLPMVTIIK